MADDLQRWLRSESRRELGRVTLEDVLVFGRFHRYLWQRSTRFALTRTIQTLLHVGELYLLFLFAPQNVFLAAALVTIGTEVAGSAWWGGLELLRSGVRRRSRDGRYAAIGPLIRCWLVAATALACTLGSGAIGFAMLESRDTGFGVGEAYVTVRLIGFGLELAVRTFHSGAYALRRIYQPTWALLAPSMARGMLLLGMWPMVALWSIPIASFCSALARALLTVWFTRRTYIDLRIWPLAPGTRHRPKRPVLWVREAGRFAAAAAANASANVGYLWALALLSFATSDPDLWLALFVYLVLAAPLLEACVAWARLFYPDLVKLEDDLLLPFRAVLQRQLTRWSSIVGTFVWLPTTLIIPLLADGRVGAVAALTWVFFIARARLAAVQVIAFCERRYATLLLISSGLGFAVGIAYLLPLDFQLACLIAALLVCSILFRPDPSPLPASRGMLPVAAVISHATRIRGEGRWILSKFRPGRLLHGPQVLLHRLARRVGALGIDRDRLLLWWRPTSLRSPSDSVLTEGFEQRRWQSAIGPPLEGLRTLQDCWPPGQLPMACALEGVVGEFKSRFPHGYCVRAGEVAVQDLRRMFTWRERQGALGEAILHAFGRPPRMLLPLDVSALVDEEHIAALFFLKRDTAASARRQWRRWLRHIAVANALAALGPKGSRENRHANLAPASADLPTRSPETYPQP